MSAKELLQIIIGSGDIGAMRTVKQAGPIAPGDLLEVGQHGGESRGTAVVVFRHGPHQRAQMTFDRVAIECVSIRQYLGDALDPLITCAHQRPQRSRGL
jgi:hypothetical protein